MADIPYIGEIFALAAPVCWAFAVILFRKTGETVPALALLPWSPLARERMAAEHLTHSVAHGPGAVAVDDGDTADPGAVSNGG